MNHLKTGMTAVIGFVLFTGIILGGYLLINYIGVQRNIHRIEQANEAFYQAIDNLDIDIENYFLYEEVFFEEGNYYIIFVAGDASTVPFNEGDEYQALLLEVDTTLIDTAYRSSINLEKDGDNYVLPALWIAGGGTSTATVQDFLIRARFRQELINQSTSISIEEITIRIEGDYCLGKIEF